MKKKLSYIISFIMIFTLLAQNIEAFNVSADSDENITGSEEITVHYEEKPIEQINLGEDEKLELFVKSSSGNKVDYQWQILVEESMWVDISGQKDSSILLSYAMVVNLLHNDRVDIRVKGKIRNEEVISQPVEVKVEYTESLDADKSTSKLSTKANVTSNKNTEIKKLESKVLESQDELRAEVKKSEVKTSEDFKNTEELTENKKENGAESPVNSVNLELSESLDKDEAAENHKSIEQQETISEEVSTVNQDKANEEVSQNNKEAEQVTEQAEGYVSKNPENSNTSEIVEKPEELVTKEKTTTEVNKQENNKFEKNINNIKVLSENKATTEESELKRHSIVINYVFENGEVAAPAYIAEIAKGTPFQDSVTSPEVMGYSPIDAEKTIDLSYDEVNQDYTITVTYKPVEVKIVINHYQQNTNDDNYTLHETVETTGLTESEVGDGRAKSYTGFYALNYDKTEKVAADGSTIINIYYDRLYYLIKFNLDGGYGVDPIYGRYGSEVTLEEIGTPSKAGYAFAGWKLDNTLVGADHFPTTIPAEVRTYTATWTAGEVSYTVVYWYENSDDDNYSYAGIYKPTTKVAVGRNISELINDTNINYNFPGRDNTYFTYNAAKTIGAPENSGTVAGDGSSIVNIYFTRNQYTLSFDLNDGRWINKAVLTMGESQYTTNKPYTITAKYGADISKLWPLDENITTYPGLLRDRRLYGWQRDDGGNTNVSKRYTLTDELIGNTSANSTTIYYAQWSTSLSTIQLNYYIESFNQSSGGGRVSRNGIWYDLSSYYSQQSVTEGGSWSAKEISGLTNVDQNSSNNPRTQNFYYTRNRYNLTFQNVDKVTDPQTVMFEQSLIDFKPADPEYPAEYEPGAYEFGGWYYTPDSIPGTEVDFANDIMPAANLNLYAKWQLVKHSVNFYLHEDSVNPIEGYDTISVLHGSTIGKTIPDPVNGNYTFVGWFYKDGGKERAFDPANMPVRRDLKLYAKWTSDKVMDYKVYYKDEDGNIIATETSGSKLAGTSITVEAKTGDELDEGYQEGYFPTVASHTIVIDIDDETKNEYTFIYKKKDKVPYTVRYLEKDTKKELADPENGESSFAIITEKFKFVKNYLPDAFQKRLILTAEGPNELIFWYEYDELHAPILTIYYHQNVSGDGYTEVARAEDFNALIGESYSAVELDYPGFTLDTSRSESERKVESLTPEGYEFKLYYNRNLYPYKFEYLKLEDGVKKPIPTSSVDADNQPIYVAPTTGTARYEAQVSQRKKDIPGYTYSESSENKTIQKIQIEEEGSLDKNRREFIYTENTVTIEYAVIPNKDGTFGGDLDSLADSNIKVFTGNPQGSTPTAKEGFKFVGWYKDEEANEPVSPTDGTTGSDNKFVPGKTKEEVFEGNDFIMYEDKTYYAKFERELTDLTISKTGAQAIDENQSFVFTVKGNDSNTKDISLTVTIEGNRSVTIKDLPIGEYIVTESDWSWRYTPENNEKSKEISVGERNNHVSFKNERRNYKWLSGDSFIKNIFNKISE